MLEYLTNVPAIIGIGLILVGIIFLVYSIFRVRKAYALLDRSQDQLNRVRREIESEKKEAYIKIKDETYKKRKEFELEMRREKIEIERLQSKVNLKKEELEKREERLEESKNEFLQKERDVSRLSDRLRANEVKLKTLYDDLIKKLEALAGMSKDEARKALLESLENEVKLSSEKWVQKVEEDARNTAKEKALDILISIMNRYTSEQVSIHSSSMVQLPNDDMKGRIIGKEGRNIKALEMATGMEFVIGDTPELITISGFNPIRREIARRTLEKLIIDGRINPTRIEETVAQCEKELNEIIQEYGKGVVLEFNLQGIHQEIVTLLGKLQFRTSYSQNVLIHSKEVGIFARMIAEELGLDPNIAFRAGLLHDIGKAVSAEVEGPHAIVGADIAKRCGEDPRVVNAIAAHHEEVPFTSIYAPIVVIADTISASRPGARRETFTAYIKRLEKLEEIGNSFEGVKKVYALQAGREIRVIVEEEFVDDEKTAMLARDLAKRIEEEMNFPGQIKVNVIREKRAIEYAR
jgi:ribonucrease Y